MLSTFFGFELGKTGLEAAQLAQDVVGNNIANANTDGYHAQRVEQTEANPFTPPDRSDMVKMGQIGQGVKVTAITRATNQYLDVQVRDANSNYAFQYAQSNNLKQVETAFGDSSDSGLSTILGKFFQSANEVASNPEDPGVRAALIQNGVSVSQSFRSVSDQLKNIDTNLTTQINDDLKTLNDYGSQIAQLNIEIRQVVTQNLQPNDLMNQRDMLVDKISKMANVTIDTQANGMMNVYIGTSDLVTGTDAHTLTMAGMTSRGDLTSGELAGLVQTQTDTQSYMSSINTLAANVISSVNAVHSAGADLYGNTGVNFFNGTDAASIQVNPTIVSDPKRFAAAAVPGGGGAPPPGDGSNASAFAAVKNQTIAAAPFNGQTLMQYYAGIVSDAGSKASSANTSADDASLNQSQYSKMRESEIGVSTDTEMLNMMKYQRSYQASASFVKTLDSMLDTLINGLH